MTSKVQNSIFSRKDVSSRPVMGVLISCNKVDEPMLLKSLKSQLFHCFIPISRNCSKLCGTPYEFLVYWPIPISSRVYQVKINAFTKTGRYILFRVSSHYNASQRNTCRKDAFIFCMYVIFELYLYDLGSYILKGWKEFSFRNSIFWQQIIFLLFLIHERKMKKLRTLRINFKKIRSFVRSLSGLNNRISLRITTGDRNFWFLDLPPPG